jgi:hypothetical protein
MNLDTPACEEFYYDLYQERVQRRINASLHTMKADKYAYLATMRKDYAAARVWGAAATRYRRVEFYLADLVGRAQPLHEAPRMTRQQLAIASAIRKGAAMAYRLKETAYRLDRLNPKPTTPRRFKTGGYTRASSAELGSERLT